MPKVKMTDRKVAGLKAVDGKQTDYWDQDTPGLSLRVSPGGTRQWALRYRTHAGYRRFAIARYPNLGLADARKKARKLQVEIGEGADPAAQRRHNRHAPPDSVNDLAERFMTEYSKPRKRTWAEDQRILDHDVLPTIGKLDPAQVTPEDIEEVLARPVERGSLIMANRTRSVCHKMFKWGKIRPNPVGDVDKPGEEQARDRVFRHHEIRTIWQRIEVGAVRPNGKRRTIRLGGQLALKLLLLLGQRETEVAGMRKDEVDREARVWTIPVARAKGKRQHRLPLPSDAIALIDQAVAIADEKCPKTAFVFPTTCATKAGPAGSDHISGGGLLHGLQHVLEGTGVEGATAHDLRRTFRTEMAALGVDRDTRDALLNHSPQSTGGKHYDWHDYHHQMRDALELWQVRLAQIISGVHAKTAT